MENEKIIKAYSKGSINELITEFTDGYYKEAGPFIKKYVDLVHEKIKEDEDKDFFLFLYGDPSQAFTSYLSPELLKKYDAFFNEAEKVVANNNDVLQRVKEARLSIDYAILEACKKGLDNDLSLTINKDNGGKTPAPFVEKKLEDFFNTCNKADITLMNEMGFTVAEYYNNYKKALAVATQPNIAIEKQVTLNTSPKKYANEDPQVLTDGAIGGNNFYANWLGFEGNHLDAVLDLGANEDISAISMAFLQVTNHVVFFPKSVTYYYSNDNKNFVKLGKVINDEPLSKTSKVNNIKYFNLDFSKVKARYIKVFAENMNEAPYWHHAAGLPSWVFADEILIK